ncbi:MAG: hypothetical protein J6L64_02700 [Opitutales bacterium]|nr:hypothetical protein [Opitutales bacterium]
MRKLLLLPLFGLFSLAHFSFGVPAFAQAESVTTVATAQKESPWAIMFPEGLLAKAHQKSEDAKREVVKKLDGKFVGIYHSASWCGFCHFFTPQLIAFYKKNKKDFEVVFVSGDKSEKQRRAYAKSSKMPWLAAPFGKENGAPGAGGYPCLHVLTPEGKILTTISGANRKESKDSRLHVDLRRKMDDWKKGAAAKE